MLDSNENYFHSRNRTLPQYSHSLRGSTRDLKWMEEWTTNIKILLILLLLIEIQHTWHAKVTQVTARANGNLLQEFKKYFDDITLNISAWDYKRQPFRLCSHLQKRVNVSINCNVFQHVMSLTARSEGDRWTNGRDETCIHNFIRKPWR
jgi:hypothetical protein